MMMKALIITMAILLGGITSGYTQNKDAQQKRTAEERAKYMTEALDKKLSLTADQKAKVYDLYLDRAKEMEKMRLQSSAERKNRMEKQKEMIADNDKKLQKILNADQYKKYQEQKAASKEKMKKHHQRKMDGKTQKDKV